MCTGCPFQNWRVYRLAELGSNLPEDASVKVLHEHQLAAGLIGLRLMNPPAIGRDSHAALLTSSTRLFKVSDRLDLLVARFTNWMDQLAAPIIALEG
jgi:hypothetical protein